MAYIDLKLTCRTDELNSIIKQVLFYYKKNLSDFEKISPKYSAFYLKNVEEEAEEVDNIIHPVDLMNELKEITTRIYVNQNLVTSSIKLLEDCAIKAKGLSIKIPEFGFNIVSRANNISGFIENLVKMMRIVAINAENNLTPLIAAGYTNTDLAFFKELSNQLQNDNEAQHTIQTEIKNLLLKAIYINHYYQLNIVFQYDLSYL